jgi:hypothetical protein
MSIPRGCRSADLRWAESAVAPLQIHVSVGTFWATAAAIATLVLAAVTAWMAYETRKVATRTQQEATAVTKQVEIATEQVATSRQALQASIRPWLTACVRFDEPIGGDTAARYGNNVIHHGEIMLEQSPNGTIKGSIPIRNVGPGLAIIDGEASRVLGHKIDHLDPDTEYGRLHTNTPVLPSGEIADLWFVIRRDSAAWVGLTLAELVGQGFGHFAVDVLYRDWANEQLMRAHVSLARSRPDGEWFIFRIDYVREDTGETVAVANYAQARGLGMLTE